MLSQPEPACLVIADITGYTGFLAGAELDHAQDILADLMSTVVAAFRPTFKLAKLEGDAAFVYTITPAVDPAQLQDTIERCYFTFRRRLRDIRQASTCECNACILVPNLDLKVVAHFGQVIRQRIASWEELVGSDVIVVHRLLKNHVEESTGFAAYALYSAGCISAMGIDDRRGPASSSIARRSKVSGRSSAGSAISRRPGPIEIARSRVEVASADSALTVDATFEAPPAVVWDWVTSPARRLQWQSGVHGHRPGRGDAGRRGVGTVNHCVHGKDAVIEEGRRLAAIRVRHLSLVAAGAERPEAPQHVRVRRPGRRADARSRCGSAGPRSAKDRAIAVQLLPMVEESARTGLAALRPLIEADAAARRAADADAALEPAVPSGQARNVREPIAAGAIAGGA
jgi:hypothetical protein